MTPAGDEPLLVLVAGKDPADEPGGGHSSYVRAHGLAAVAAGFEPVVLCVGASSGTYEADFGTVHRVRSPWRPLRQLAIPGHEPILRDALVGLAGRSPGSVVLAHGFGVWGVAGVSAVARLREQGRSAAAAVSSYTVYRVEHDSLVRGAGGEPVLEQLRYRSQALWAAGVVERWERRGYRGADRVWVNYRSVEHLIHEQHGPDVRVDRIGYGPESSFEPLPVPGSGAADPWPARDGRLRVLCVSRHHSRKGVDVLIDALAQLGSQGVGVTAQLVGRGPLVEAHRRRVEELGLSGSVVVTGGVDSVDPYLLGADVYVLPSREEQSGSLALLEAQRLGLPVVASAVDGIPEDVTDDVTGLLVPPGDIGALASAIESLAADPARRRRIGDAGRARFEERFAAGPFTAAMAAAYADLLSAAGPGPVRR